ncbi:MAG TPA: 2-aminoethylphosphonate ABC transporter permease subunit [Xanthobacteraceae bacterium]
MAEVAVVPLRASAPPAGAWIVPPVLILGVLFFYPLALIARQALSGGGEQLSLDHAAAVMRTNLFQVALWHTIEIAVASSAGCLLLGFVIALILSFVPFPGAREVARFIDTFIALPTFLMALAFTFIYGSAGVVNGALMEAFGYELPPVDFLYSVWGVILAEVTVYTPFVLRPLLAAFSQIETAQIEVAGSLGAGPWRIVLEIILPAGLPALLAGGSLCLLLTVNEFGIVLFIGAKGVITLPLLVYDKAIQQGDYTAACVIAVINIALSLTLYTLYRNVLARVGGRNAGVV